MAQIEILIDGKSVYLPDGFTLPFERVNPTLELDNVILGDYSFNINIPLGKNETLLTNAHRIELADRTLVYNCQVYHFGRVVMLGVALLQGSELRAGGLGKVSMAIISNAFGIDSYKVTLAEALQGVSVNLGSSTAAIIAAAKAQNNAALSADGVTGSVMRFPATQNPEFYGDSNPEWYPTNVRTYEFDREYKKGESVYFRFTTNTVLVYLANNYGPREYLCTAKEDTLESQSPENTPDKWQVDDVGIINAWNIDTQAFEVNDSYDPLLKAVNYRNLVPYLQLHDVIRKVFETYGYQVGGTFMTDSVRRHALIYSNFALDKIGPKPNYCRVGVEDLDISALALDPVTFDLEAFPFEDTNDRWDGVKYTNPLDGYIEIQGEITWRNDGPVNDGFRGGLSFVSPYSGFWNVDDLDLDFIAPGASQSFTFSTVIEASAADEIQFTATVPPGNITIKSGWISFRHLETDSLNQFDGTVRYSDHVPDMEVIDFLRALRTAFNLRIELDPIGKSAQINYHEEAYLLPQSPADNSEIAQVGYKAKHTQLRRFRMQYGELPEDVFQPNETYEVLDPVDEYTDLPIPEAENRAILVKERNAWFVTQYQFRGTFTYWEYAGQHYPATDIGASGDLVNITPDLGPMSLRRMLLPMLAEVWSVHVNELGRSAMFKPGGSRPPLRIVYSYSNDFTAGSPYDFGFSNTRKSAMDWERIYADHFKKTLAAIAREERVEMLLKIPLAQLINPDWQRFKLVNNVLFEYLRQVAVFGRNNMVKVEARKVRVEALEIVGDAEESEPDPGPDPTYLFNLIPAPLLTLGMSKKVEGYGGDAAQIENNADGVFELPFNSSGYADMAAANAFFTEDADPNLYYDQYGDNDFNDDSAGTQYSKADNDFMTGLMRRTHSITPFTGPLASLKNNDPYSIVLVVDSKDIPTTGNTIYPLKFPGGTGSLRMVWSGNGTTLIVRYEGPNQGWQFSGLRTAGTKLIIITSAGGSPLHRDGLKLYWNGNTTPEVASHSYNSGNPAEQTITGVEAGAWGGDSWFKEYDLLGYEVTPVQVPVISDWYIGKGYEWS